MVPRYHFSQPNAVAAILEDVFSQGFLLDLIWSWFGHLGVSVVVILGEGIVETLAGTFVCVTALAGLLIPLEFAEESFEHVGGFQMRSPGGVLGNSVEHQRLIYVVPKVQTGPWLNTLPILEDPLQSLPPLPQALLIEYLTDLLHKLSTVELAYQLANVALQVHRTGLLLNIPQEDARLLPQITCVYDRRLSPWYTSYPGILDR